MFDNYLPLFEDLRLPTEMDVLAAHMDQMLSDNDTLDLICGEEDESWMY